MTTVRLRAAERSWLPVAVLLLLSVAGWAATVRWAREMGNGPGPMGLSLAAFVRVWVVMMAAMMLPTLSASALVGSRARNAATTAFTAGYLTVWALVGGAFYFAARGTERLAADHHDVAVGVAVTIFLVCAAYQVSGWKARTLHACARPDIPPGPLSTAYREGARCGSRCLAASWSLMALLLAIGFMQLLAMIVLTAALLVERRADRRTVSVALGVAAFGYGIAVAVHPALAPGLAVTHAMVMPMS